MSALDLAAARTEIRIQGEHIAALEAKLEAMERPTVETMLRVLAEIGIYPRAIIGEYEQRTDFMDGWNAALIEIGKQLAVLPAAQQEKEDE